MTLHRLLLVALPTFLCVRAAAAQEPAPSVVKCYGVEVGGWVDEGPLRSITTGEAEDVPRMRDPRLANAAPALLELRAEQNSVARGWLVPARQLRTVPRPDSAAIELPVGDWIESRPGEIRAVWSRNGWDGYEMRLSPTEGGLAGTWRSFSDFWVPQDPLSVGLTRTGCPARR